MTCKISSITVKDLMSPIMREPAFAYAKTIYNKLHGNCAADQCLCFCYIGSTIPLLPKSEISSL